MSLYPKESNSPCPKCSGPQLTQLPNGMVGKEARKTDLGDPAVGLVHRFDAELREMKAALAHAKDELKEWQDGRVRRTPDVALENQLRTQVAQLRAALKHWEGKEASRGHRCSDVEAELSRLREAIKRGEFIGPCEHGRDPYDRCDECSSLSPPVAEIRALRAELAQLRAENKKFAEEIVAFGMSVPERVDLESKLKRAKEALVEISVGKLAADNEHPLGAYFGQASRFLNIAKAALRDIGVAP